MNRSHAAAVCWNGQAGFAEIAFRRLPLVSLLTTAVIAGLAGHSWSAAAAPLPWIVSLAVVGLPHGAADLAVTRRLVPGGARVAVWAAYVAIMATTGCAFVVAPLPVMALFVVLSCWHFGRSHADTQGLPTPPGRALGSCAAVARGAAVIGVPLLNWPGESAGVAGNLLRLTGREAAAAGWSPIAVRGLGAGLVAAGLAAFLAEWLLGRRRPAVRRGSVAAVVDLAIIACLAVAADPLLSVGMYFLIWHAWRQMGALAPVVAGVAPRSAPVLARCLLRIHVAALPLLVPTWVAIGTAWMIASVPRSWHDLAMVSIAAYLVVTPAHELLGDVLHAAFAPRSEAAGRRQTHCRPGSHPCTARRASSSA